MPGVSTVISHVDHHARVVMREVSR
jgi:hypothetical protein